MIYDNITELIGNTPLLRLNRLNEGHAEILAKLEFFNPCSSSKDRIAFAMVNDARQRGLLTENTQLIEPTAGNMGISLAMVAAACGLQLLLTMPETVGAKRQRHLEAFGARLELTQARIGMKGTTQHAEKLAAAIPDSLMLDQFSNPVNPVAHRETTAEEILRDTDNTVDIFVAGVGTGGTISGVGSKLKEKLPEVKIVAVEPTGSPVLSGGASGPHRLVGIGPGFVPETLDTGLLDEIICVSDEEAAEAVRATARREGLLIGISSGAVLAAARRLSSREENKGKRIVVILADAGERYLNTWVFDTPNRP